MHFYLKNNYKIGGVNNFLKNETCMFVCMTRNLVLVTSVVRNELIIMLLTHMVHCICDQGLKEVLYCQKEVIVHFLVCEWCMGLPSVFQ